MKGVIAFLTAKDIPGKNVFYDKANNGLLGDFDEKVIFIFKLFNFTSSLSFFSQFNDTVFICSC